jgi:hypothetical protein
MVVVVTMVTFAVVMMVTYIIKVTVMVIVIAVVVVFVVVVIVLAMLVVITVGVVALVAVIMVILVVVVVVVVVPVVMVMVMVMVMVAATIHPQLLCHQVYHHRLHCLHPFGLPRHEEATDVSVPHQYQRPHRLRLNVVANLLDGCNGQRQLTLVKCFGDGLVCNLVLIPNQPCQGRLKPSFIPLPPELALGFKEHVMDGSALLVSRQHRHLLDARKEAVLCVASEVSLTQHTPIVTSLGLVQHHADPLPGGHVHLTHERHPSLLLRLHHLHSVSHEGHGHLALSPLALIVGALAVVVDCLEGLLSAESHCLI